MASTESPKNETPHEMETGMWMNGTEKMTPGWVTTPSDANQTGDEDIGLLLATYVLALHFRANADGL